MKSNVYLGIDLGGTSIKMGVITQEGRLLGIHEKYTPDSLNEIIQTLDQITKVILEKNHLTWDHVIGVGLGVPGFVDPNSQIVLEAPNIRWKNVNIKELLQQKWNVQVEVDNDANAAALGEHWVGSGQGASNIICITIGTGIGGGIVVNGDIIRGVSGMAGEIGHFNLNMENGRPCNCGKKGCFETEASATAMVYYGIEELKKNSSQALKEVFEETGNITARTIIELAQKNDPTCKKIIANVGHLIGKTLSNISILLNPEKIIIGGGVSNAGDLLLKPLIDSFKIHALPSIAEHTSIVKAKLGNQAGTIGAAWLVHNKLFPRKTRK